MFLSVWNSLVVNPDFNNAFDLIQEKTNENPMDVFSKAMENITPSLEVKSRRVGGANY